MCKNVEQLKRDTPGSVTLPGEFSNQKTSEAMNNTITTTAEVNKIVARVHACSEILNRYVNDRNYRNEREQRWQIASGGTTSFLDNLKQDLRDAVEALDEINFITDKNN